MNKRLFALRGAVCVDNTKESITEWVCKMCNEIVQKNDLIPADVVSIQFTVTKDITKLNPATALRKGDMQINVSNIPLFCSQEPEIEGCLEGVIRVLIHCYMDEFHKRHNVYVNGAERLRPDFFEDK